MLTCTPNATLHTQDYVLNLRNYNFAHLMLLLLTAYPKSTCTPERMLNFDVILHTLNVVLHT